MLEAVVLIATFLAALVFAQTVAHALEMPGKLRLNREQYYTVQTIYYPGFTIGGTAEPLSIVAVAAALLIGRPGVGGFWLVAGALAALVVTHVLFWVVVQPVNRQWLGTIKLSNAADHFFRTGQAGAPTDDWTKLRDRWERGHLARAVTATVAFVLLLLAAASGE